MAYSFVEPILSLQQINQFDFGIFLGPTPTVSPTPPAYLDMIVKASDPTYGVGEFILLKGIASTVAGSLVTYDPTTYATALCPSTANLARPVAVAMSANIVATTYGWYQISGTAVVSKPTNKYMNALASVGVSGTAGKVVGSVSAGAGKQILGTWLQATAATAATTCTVLINRPHMQGRIT